MQSAQSGSCEAEAQLTVGNQIANEDMRQEGANVGGFDVCPAWRCPLAALFGPVVEKFKAVLVFHFVATSVERGCFVPICSILTQTGSSHLLFLLTKRKPCHGRAIKVNFRFPLRSAGWRAILGHQLTKECSFSTILDEGARPAVRFMRAAFFCLAVASLWSGVLLLECLKQIGSAFV